MSVKFWPPLPPNGTKTVYCRHRQKFVSLSFSICISINSEWSKSMILRGKFKITEKPFKYIILRFRTFCILFSLKKSHLVADRELTTPPPLVYEHFRNYYVFLRLPAYLENLFIYNLSTHGPFFVSFFFNLCIII